MAARQTHLAATEEELWPRGSSTSALTREALGYASCIRIIKSNQEGEGKEEEDGEGDEELGKKIWRRGPWICHHWTREETAQDSRRSEARSRPGRARRMPRTRDDLPPTTCYSEVGKQRKSPGACEGALRPGRRTGRGRRRCWEAAKPPGVSSDRGEVRARVGRQVWGDIGRICADRGDIRRICADRDQGGVGRMRGVGLI